MSNTRSRDFWRQVRRAIERDGQGKIRVTKVSDRHTRVEAKDGRDDAISIRTLLRAELVAEREANGFGCSDLSNAANFWVIECGADQWAGSIRDIGDVYSIVTRLVRTMSRNAGMNFARR